MSSSPKRSSLKTVFFWLTFFVLALLVVATSSLATRVYRVEGAQDLEIVDASADPRDAGPETPRLTGPVLAHEGTFALPSLHDVSQSDGLKRARFRIDLDRYLARPAPCCEPRAGLPMRGDSRIPGTSLLISQALDGMDVYLNGVWVAGLPKSTAAARYKWYRPLQVPLARSLVRPDGNVLTVELPTWDRRVLIAPIYIGDLDTLSYIGELTLFVGT